jgi:hypothetical protein
MVDYGFKYPMTVSGLGMVSSSILSYAACRPSLGLVELKFHGMTYRYWVRNCLPVGLFMVSGGTAGVLRVSWP